MASKSSMEAPEDSDSDDDGDYEPTSPSNECVVPIAHTSAAQASEIDTELLLLRPNTRMLDGHLSPEQTVILQQLGEDWADFMLSCDNKHDLVRAHMIMKVMFRCSVARCGLDVGDIGTYYTLVFFLQDVAINNNPDYDDEEEFDMMLPPRTLKKDVQSEIETATKAKLALIHKNALDINCDLTAEQIHARQIQFIEATTQFSTAQESLPPEKDFKNMIKVLFEAIDKEGIASMRGAIRSWNQENDARTAISTGLNVAAENEGKIFADIMRSAAFLVSKDVARQTAGSEALQYMLRAVMSYCLVSQVNKIKKLLSKGKCSPELLEELRLSDFYANEYRKYIHTTRLGDMGAIWEYALRKSRLLDIVDRGKTVRDFKNLFHNAKVMHTSSTVLGWDITLLMPSTAWRR